MKNRLHNFLFWLKNIIIVSISLFITNIFIVSDWQGITLFTKTSIGRYYKPYIILFLSFLFLFFFIYCVFIKKKETNAKVYKKAIKELLVGIIIGYISAVFAYILCHAFVERGMYYFVRDIGLAILVAFFSPIYVDRWIYGLIMGSFVFLFEYIFIFFVYLFSMGKKKEILK